MRSDVRTYRILLLIAAMLLATIAIGWLGVLFVAVVFASIDRHWSVPADAGFSAAVAWLLLFLGHAVLPGASIVALVGRAMTLPTLVLPLMTVVYPGLLAWSSAVVTVALSGQLGRPRRLDRRPAVIAD